MHRCLFRCMSTRVRFAPSPTGNLHLGGLRTAFLNYLFAKKNGGSFILRLEDTDQRRFVPKAAEEIEKMLCWAGIVPDESPIVGGSFGPYVQSQRTGLYKEYCELLLENGSAYPCFCTSKRLELMKKDANRTKRPNKYDRRCLNLSKSEIEDKLKKCVPHTIRFKLRPFKEGYNDMVFGHSSHDVFELESDPIIMKSDGYPTYHFANVVDDYLMKITHVFRGVEWQVSTPKHIMLYEAFGWKPPIFAHLPLIINSDGTKLSKRNNDITLQYYKESGYLPESIQNFMATVGGGFDERDQSCEILYNKDELINKFNPNRISTMSGRVEKEKLNMINRCAIKSRLSDGKLRTGLFQLLRDVCPETSEISEGRMYELMNWSWNRIHKLSDIRTEKSVSFAWFPFEGQIELTESSLELLKNVKTILLSENCDLGRELKLLSKRLKVGYPTIMEVIRETLCGVNKGPPIKEIVDMLGVTNVVRRIDDVLYYHAK